MKLTTRWYYTFKEICEQYNEDSNDWPIDLAPMDGLATTLCYIAAAEGALSENTWWGDLDTEAAQEMFQGYLWPEFQDASLIYVDKEVNPWELNNEEEPEHEEVWEEFKHLIPRIIRWLKESEERYQVLISAYKSIENDLLAQVKTVTESEALSTQLNEGVNSSSVSGSDGSTVAVESVTHGSASSTNTGSESSSVEGSGTEQSVGTVNASKVHLENDTPQASWSDGFAADPYVSKMTKDEDGSRSVNSTESTNNSSTTSTSSSSGENANTASTSTSTTSTGNNSSTINGSNSSNARGTNSQSSVVGSDVTTPIERLNEIRQKLHNLYADWADEFSRFVIYAD